MGLISIPFICKKKGVRMFGFAVTRVWLHREKVFSGLVDGCPMLLTSGFPLGGLGALLPK